MQNRGELPLNAINVNNSLTKSKFHKLYGSSEYIVYGINANQNLNSYDFEKYLYMEFVWKKIEKF